MWLQPGRIHPGKEDLQTFEKAFKFNSEYSHCRWNTLSVNENWFDIPWVLLQYFYVSSIYYDHIHMVPQRAALQK